MGRLNKSKGNMYEWLTHTWSPIQGCPHQCSYCYVRAYKNLPKQIIIEVPFPPLGTGRKIFVGHMGDLFANGVPSSYINSTLKHCNKYTNEYIFQSKNTERLLSFIKSFPVLSTIGTTIETDNEQLLKGISTAPTPIERARALYKIGCAGFKTFLTIEPIMDFDIRGMTRLITVASPKFINIGADSKGHSLNEPSRNKINQLIDWCLKYGYTINKKRNLERLL